MSVIKELCWMLAEHRCRPSRVASQLTFVPPCPPFYKLADDGSGSGRLTCTFDPRVAYTPFDNLQIFMLTTSRKHHIPAFYYTHPEATHTLLYSHGNAADCGMMREDFIELCTQFKVNVLGYDYSGYGAATGTPSEANTYADINAAYDFLVDKGLAKGSNIIVYGQSVGSGPSVKLAVCKSRPICALILHSPIMSGIRVLTPNRGPLACCDIYPNINRIARVKVPVLVIHGTMDEEVGFNHGVGMQDAVPNDMKTEPLWVDGAGHNDIVEEFTEQYYTRMHAFFEKVTGRKLQPSHTNILHGLATNDSHQKRDDPSHELKMVGT